MTTNNMSYAKNINYQDKEKISIVIPYLGEYGKVLDIIENINKLFYHIEKDIIIVDDASVNKNFYINLVKKNSYVIVRHDKNKGFGASVNSGLKQVKGKYAVVCHNDVKFFDKNTLTNLVGSIKKLEFDNVAIVSAVTNNPLINSEELTKNNASDEPAYISKMNYLPMYCSCVNVRAVLSVGGVPEHPYAWFEDQLLCHNLKERGYKLGICPSAHVVHEGMGTIKPLVNYNPTILNIMKSNADRVKNINKDNI